MAKASSTQSKPKSAKQRERALQRLLNRAALPPEVRAAKEAELAGLHRDVQKQSRVNRERHFSKKYHGVKFIERRKVERRIAQLERNLEREPDAAAAAAALREAQHDLLYIQHFPRAKKYLSLFPNSDGDNAYVAKRRRRIRALIVRRVEAGLPVGRIEDAEDDEDEDEDASAPPQLDGDEFFAGADEEEPEQEPPDAGEEQEAPAPAAAAAPARKKQKKAKR